MQDDVQTEDVGQVDEGENVDAMPEETPDQSQAEAPPSETPAHEPDAAPAFSLEGLDPTQVQAWQKDSENRHEWQKANTQKAQELAEQRRALEQQAQYWQQFQNDPVVRALAQARERIAQNPELLADVERFNAGTAQPGQQQSDPLVNTLYGKVQTLEQQLAAQQYHEQEEARNAAALAAQQAVEKFRSEHEMTDEQFGQFYQNVYIPSGVPDLETAFKIYDYDGAQARARQQAQTEVEAVENEKAQAASTVVPGSHTPDVYEGNPHDTEFEGARSRSMSRYNLGLSED